MFGKSKPKRLRRVVRMSRDKRHKKMVKLVATNLVKKVVVGLLEYFSER